MHEMYEEAREILCNRIIPGLPPPIRKKIEELLPRVVLRNNLLSDETGVYCDDESIVIAFSEVWVDAYIKTPEDVTGVILHELLHVALNQLTTSNSKIKNLASDCIVQSIARHCETYNEDACEIMNAFRRYYANDDTLTMLCCPPPVIAEEANVFMDNVDKYYTTEIANLYNKVYPREEQPSKLYKTAITALLEDDISSLLNTYTGDFVGFDGFYLNDV